MPISSVLLILFHPFLIVFIALLHKYLVPIPFQNCLGMALIIFQFLLYETVINNCCVKSAAGTFFGLIVVSSVAIFILPIATSLVSSSGSGLAISDDSLKKALIDSGGRRSGFHTNHSVDYHELYSHNPPYDIYIRHLLHPVSASASASASAINGNGSSSSLINTTNTSPSPSDGSNNNHSSLFGPSITPWVLFFTIVVCLTFYRVAATSAFTTLGIVVNDSVDKEMRGKLVSEYWS